MNTRPWLIVGIVALGVIYFTQAKKVRSMISRLGDKFTRLHPRVQKHALNVIDRLAMQGITVGIPHNGGWRSVDVQGGIDPNNTNVRDPLDSYHAWGLAVDFVPINAAGNFHWPPAHDPVWTKIGAAIKAEGGEWGGDWRSLFDGPHGQWPILTLSQLKAHYSNPLDFIEGERSKYRGFV